MNRPDPTYEPLAPDPEHVHEWRYSLHFSEGRIHNAGRQCVLCSHPELLTREDALGKLREAMASEQIAPLP